MSLRAFAYRPGDVKEIPPDDYARFEGYNTWISAFKPEKHELDWIFSRFSLHPLVVEDILSRNDAPKVDEHAGYTFVITDIPAIEDGRTVVYKLFLILGKDFLVSITDHRDTVRTMETRVINKDDTIDDMGPGYLAYSLIDQSVDRFYPVLDDIEDVIVDVEDSVITSVDRGILIRMADARRDLLTLRKSAWRIRDVVLELGRGSSPFIAPSTLIYLRDIYDHVTQIMDLIETYRDMLTSAREIYMSAVSVSLNKVMKQLTIIATIMLPLTFIVGIYGMNFKYMPELQWEYGYYTVWAVIILITVGMLVYFRLKKWL
ncbi:MAG TPA: magnesium/cobalt transporter CorA [Methanocella sp.]|jgi:magnesium transporter